MSERHNGPPSWILSLFRWFCHPDIVEDVEGDILERYALKRDKSAFAANRYLLMEVLRLFRPSLLRDDLFYLDRFRQKLKINYMVRHNTLVSFRSFQRNRTSFLINLLGLTTGIASVLLIFLWVQSELSVDKFHENDTNLFKIKAHHEDASGIRTWSGVPGLLLDEIQARIPESQYSVAETEVRNFTVSDGAKYIKADIKFASDGFFRVFSHKLIHGSKTDLLRAPDQAVITAGLSKRLFGSTNSIGKTFDWHLGKTKKQFMISAVMEDPPANSSEPFEIILPWSYYHDELITFKQWGNYYARISTVIQSPEQKVEVEEKLNHIFAEHNSNERVHLSLERYSDDYLYGNYSNGEKDGGRITYVRLFITVAFLILLIACINFINLSTARAANRAKEVGVKKTLGANRYQIIFQFFTESFLISFFATILGGFLVVALLPYFNHLSDKQLSFLTDWWDFLILFGIAAGTAIVAGIYPAFYLSRMRMAGAKKASIPAGNSDHLLRKGLVVFQFCLSILLIAAVLTVQDQMKYIQGKQLGFDRNNVVYFEREGKLVSQPEAFISALEGKEGIEQVALSEFMIGGGNSTGGVSWPGKTEADQVQFWEIEVGDNAPELLGLTLVEGRMFSREYANESGSVMINQTAAMAMGIKDLVGSKITHYTGDKKIVGIVEDFHLRSLHENVEPAILLYEPSDVRQIMVRLKPGNTMAGLETIERVHKEFNGDYPLNLRFLDEDYQKQYSAEKKVAVLSRYFAGIAIIISCLGLFGLATFTTEKRYKEIGIRKTLGAERVSIIWLLTRDFGKLVMIAVLISLPVSYLMTGRWLDNFAYHSDLSLTSSLVAAALAIAIAFITVGAKTMKAASINPSKCLRDE